MKIFLKVFVCGVFLFVGGMVSAQSYEELEKIVASDAAGGDTFGLSVSVDGNRAVVGAYRDDDAGADSGSAYIYEWNGNTWNQTAKLVASDAEAGDYFGQSVSVSEDRVLVGAYKKASYTGAVYVYDWNGTTWVETKLTASDGGIYQRLGYSVSISGDKIIAGAFGTDDDGADSGSAYIYEWNGVDTWDETKLTANDAAAGDNFGNAVFIGGDKAIVGAYHNDDAGDSSGSAYIYEWNGVDTWDETKVTADDAFAGDLFGASVSIAGDKAIVGANGDESYSGSAYIYEWNGNAWVETKLTAGDIAVDDYFGWSVSISGNRAIVGARSNADLGANTGSAYIYDLSGSSWVETKIIANDTVGGDYLGWSVSVSGDSILVGANGDDDAGGDSGSAYFFVSSVGPDKFCTSGDIATLNNPIADSIYWDWDGNSPYLANSGGTAVVVIIAPSETVKATTAELPAAGTAEPGMVYFDEETGELYISDATGTLQDPATITSNAVADTAAVEASAVVGEVYFNTTTGEVFYCEVDGVLDNPADPSSSCLTQ